MKASAITLNSPCGDIKGIGPKKAQALAGLGINSLSDMLWNFPRDYEDRRNIKEIRELRDGEKVLVKARVIQMAKGRGFGPKRTLKLLAEDRSGRMEIIFFKGAFLERSFTVGEEYCFFGKVKAEENSRPVMFHPSFTPADEDGETGILPVYSLTKGVTQKELRRLSKMALALLPSLKETLPESIIKKVKLCSLQQAVNNIHFPTGRDSYRQARDRLIYEELFDLKAALILSRDRFGRGREGYSMKGSLDRDFLAGLPYSLTGAQQKVLEELRIDMESPKAMNRLVQGDVGSGKTIIAQCALLKAVSSGFQAAFMAPTEILARQHFQTLIRDFKDLDVKLIFLSGSLGQKDRRAALEAIKSGEADIVVGTHAIISEGVEFSRLGLVITDEQHRFGVNQRRALAGKGSNPDVLVMTATPIPRTLAAVLYGDLDVSVIDELPPGRREIITERFEEKTRKKAYKIMEEQVKEGRQCYIVAPFIEDSEALEGRSAEGLYSQLCSEYRDFSFGLVHGAMKQSEKDAVMEAFTRGDIDVLVSTVVIEVGINVPNATVMIIENSERFGLAQLHQLRGRVGRGSHQSYCLIVTGESSEVALDRAKTMCDSSDGFVIAEKDLEMRGPGELFGYRQHGLPQLRLADPVRHKNVVALAAEDAAALLKDDPDLSKEENAGLREKIYTSFAMTGDIVL